MSSRMPDGNEQGRIISNFQFRFRVEIGEEYYVVSKRWWQNFVDYSNYTHFISKLEGQNNEGEDPKSNGEGNKPSKIDNGDKKKMSSRMPDGNEQGRIISNFQFRFRVEIGEEYYVVSKRWWQNFVDYSNYTHFISKLEGQNNEGEDPKSNGEGNKPSKIDNGDLIEPDTKDLKDKLVEHDQYVLLTKSSWDALYGWYGDDDTIRIIRKGIEYIARNNKRLSIEIYPLRLKTFDRLKMDFEPKIIIISKSDTIKKLMDTICKEYYLPIHKTKLWYWNGTEYVKIFPFKENSDNKILYDLGIESEESDFIVEQKLPSGKYEEEPPPLRKIYLEMIEKMNRRKNNLNNNLNNFNGNSSSSNYTGGSIFMSKDVKECEEKSDKSGLTGLANLGNTCFMNAAVQVLSNTPPLQKHFLSGNWKKEVNKNNALGCEGKLAKSFHKLLKKMWVENMKYVTPTAFRKTLIVFAPQFQGYLQHDSHELLAYLLDGLHEDLNRVKEKKMVEMKVEDNMEEGERSKKFWELYLKRNDSIIVDIFCGQIKSTLTCPECKYISRTYDTFQYLSLPIPYTPPPTNQYSNKTMSSFGYSPSTNYSTSSSSHPSVLSTIKIRFFKFPQFSAENEPAEIKQFVLEGSMDENVFDIKQKLFALLKKDADIYHDYENFGDKKVEEEIEMGDILLFEIYQQYTYGHLDDNKPITQIERNQLIHAYQVVPFYAEKGKKNMIVEESDVSGNKKKDNKKNVKDDKKNVNDKNVDNQTKITDVDSGDKKKNSDKDILDKKIHHKLDTEIKISTKDSLMKKKHFLVQFLLRIFDKKEKSLKYFGVPLVVKFYAEDLKNISSLKHFYSIVWKLCGGKVQIQKKEEEYANIKKYPFQLKRTNNSGKSCSLCESSKKCKGCPINEKFKELFVEEDILLALNPSYNISLHLTFSLDFDPSFNPASMFSYVNGNDLLRANGLLEEDHHDKKNDDKEIFDKKMDEDILEYQNFIENENKSSKKGNNIVIVNTNRSKYSKMNGDINKIEGETMSENKQTDKEDKEPPEHRNSKEDKENKEESKTEEVKIEEIKKEPTTLFDCFNLFTKEEILSANDTWYCTKCKNHVQAKKKIDLWKLPKVLILQLKRFQAGRFFDKIASKIEFPLKDLNLKDFLTNNENDSATYDLIGTINHSGGLSGGHYTAYAKNGDNFYNFNDKNFSLVNNPNDIITTSSYVLFYQRRD
eukprot:TRINITY_DN4863_c0_g1_i1.p1 TRINITY_DN4863_c0_g1~~TRINITY_DN4863_c0_g1_i1.p1  ORF type:complete len:1222 (-),score=389.81 TRINITY_DN4863_c0_g1_i1:15-3647(-)